MACLYAERLGAFLDGELPPPEQAACETHLLACPECAIELERLKQVSRLLSTALEAARKAPHERLTCARLKQRTLLRWSKALALAASLLFALSGLVLVETGVRPYSATDVAWEQTAVAPQLVAMHVQSIDPVAQELLGMRP